MATERATAALLDEVRQRRRLTTADAVAWGAALARPHVVPVYPSTPGTAVLPKLVELAERGVLTGDLLPVESGRAAMAAALDAARGGARVFVAADSQSLARMHELLHDAAVARAPIVVSVVDRTPAPGGGVPALAQRDTGWLQLYADSPQEALDAVLYAHRVAETVRVPAMVVVDRVPTARTSQRIDVPDAATAAAFLRSPESAPFVPAAPRGFPDPTATPAQWRADRLALHLAMTQVPEVLADAAASWTALTGRTGGAVDAYRAGDAADVLVVAMGALAGRARAAIDVLRDDAVAAGLLRLRLFRPFPAAHLLPHIAGVDHVVVLDRDCSAATGGVLAHDLRATLAAHGEHDARVGSYALGVGGVEVLPERIVAAVRHRLHGTAPVPGVVFEEAL